MSISGLGSSPRCSRVFSCARSSAATSSRWYDGGAAALDGVAQRALEPGPVDLALDEEVLRAGGQRLGSDAVVDAAGQHDDRHVGDLARAASPAP